MGEGPISIPRYILSLLICIPDLRFLSQTVVEISLTKNLERKKKEQIQGRTNGECPFSIPRNNMSL